ncbi:MAG: N-acetyltransferase [Enterococcus sp.]
MLTHYRKENQKIAMGLLSFRKNLKERDALKKEIESYETNDQFELFFFTPEGSANIQGIVGFEWVGKKELLIHDLALNPSYRGEKMGFQILDELHQKYSDVEFKETEEIAPYLSKWKEQENRKSD